MINGKVSTKSRKKNEVEITWEVGKMMMIKSWKWEDGKDVKGKDDGKERTRTTTRYTDKSHKEDSKR